MSSAAAQRTRTVADAVGEALAATGVSDAFGVLGSGNLVVTNALCSRGSRFHHARHECGAICMADGYARVSGRVGICSVHQGPGLTNTATGLTEAAKSRTPVLVLAGESPLHAVNSNFRIDQCGFAEALGAGWERIASAQSAERDALRAYERARTERRPIVLCLPIDLQAQPAADAGREAGDGARADGSAAAAGVAGAGGSDPAAGGLDEREVEAVADALARAMRPVIIAGRGAVLSGARAALERLGQLAGALLATSAPANGLFSGLDFSLGIAGGFASPTAAQLLSQADLVLAAGASLNQWTTRHGQLIAEGATVAQIDIEPEAIGRHRPAQLSIHGDVADVADALGAALERRPQRSGGWRSDEIRRRIAAGAWSAEAYQDTSDGEWIDPRTLSIEVDRRLPAERAVAVDSGHFLGWPSMFLAVSDPRAWVFPNGFQAVGLGLGCAIGAAIAHPERPTVAAIGDGGAFMALAEIETAVRESLKLLVLIYDDAAYGAEVHHFAPMGHDVSRVRFRDADLAGIAAAAGAAAATVRALDDLRALDAWLAEERPRPLVLDAKVTPTVCADWLAEAFRTG
ncbi:MAG TPA: thiamine pyrophosphate-binding protein [Solirubrobacteraceae bacterium]|nr:thiamine pyrophosphate-binding protein [Solirubrobacteraceae bacterium]